MAPAADRARGAIVHAGHHVENAVSAFYPHEFGGEDASGWDTQRLGVLEVESRVRTSQQVQRARENLARLRARAREATLDALRAGDAATPC